MMNEANAGMIDIHSHILLPAWRDSYARATGQSPESALFEGLPLPALWDTDAALREMDQCGVSTRVLSWLGGTAPLTGATGRALARTVNEQLAELVARHPKRFGAFAMVPQDDPEAAAEETAYALDVLELDGIAATTNMDGIYLGDPTLAPWFEAMDARGAVLFVHPRSSPSFHAQELGFNVATLEFMFETTRMIAKLLATGAKARYTRIRIIATHAGGATSAVVHRLLDFAPMFKPVDEGRRVTAEEIMTGLGSFYYDLTSSTDEAALEALKRFAPAGQILMGFDAPYVPAIKVQPAQQAVLESAHFSAAEKVRIFSGNALNLLPRLARQYGAAA